MDNDAGEQKVKEVLMYPSDSDEGSSKLKKQRLLKAKKFVDNDEKEELRLRILSRRESRQRRMKASQNKRFLRISYQESESDDEEVEGEEMISLAAIKDKYKALIRGLKGKRPKNADNFQAQRPRKIRRIISDDEEEDPSTLKRKAEVDERPVKKHKKSMIRDDENGCGDEG